MIIFTKFHEDRKKMCFFFQWSIFECVSFFLPQTLLVIRRVLKCYGLTEIFDISFQTLPDQSHCYFLSDHDSLNGYVVKKIPFSHPAQVPRILAILRKQAVFNAILSSCIRTSGIQGTTCFFFLFLVRLASSLLEPHSCNSFLGFFYFFFSKIPNP